VLAGRAEEALAWTDKALLLADRLGLAEHRVRALDARGMARCDLGDLGGVEDLRAALRQALDLGAGFDAAVIYNNLAEPLWLSEGPATALETCLAALDFAERRGLAEAIVWIRGSTRGPLFDLGRWDEVVHGVDEVVAFDRAHGGDYAGVWSLMHKAQVLRCRGDLPAALALCEAFVPQAREIDDLQVLVPSLVAGALVRQAAGDLPAALALAEELGRVTRERDSGAWYCGQHVADLVRVCVAGRRRALALQLLEGSGGGTARHRHGRRTAQAVLAEAGGALDEGAAAHEEAEAAWAAYGHLLERAQARLGAGRCLTGLGRPGAEARLREARAVLAGLGARPLLREADAWLARVASRSS
jgi:hypothetical protein